MAGNLLSADTSFPNLEKGSVNEKIQAITGYLYMLLEQLRYSLSNLGESNFNDTELDAMSKTITHPLTLRIEDAEGNVAQLILRADGLESSVEDLEGNLSQVTQTAGMLESKVTDLNGKYSALTQTVNGVVISDGWGNTYISGNKIKTGTIDGTVFRCTMESGASESTGQLTFRMGNSPVGTLCLDTGGAGSTVQAKQRLVLKTSTSDVVLKLYSAGNSSFEAGNSMYQKAQGELLLEAGQGVRILAKGSSKQYEFRTDGIYYNGHKILTTGE